ncbi:MAG: sigma-70 family RNA polymerase sigma factor [Myxococcales bacterium]
MLSLRTTTEEELMSQYAAGDDIASRQLFALLTPQLRAFFLRSFMDPALADDLMQTTFLRLHRARSSYIPELPLKPWVFTIAASVRRDELRRRYRLPPHVSEVELEQAESRFVGDVTTGRETDGARDIDAARAAIERLPESQRAVIHLHCQEELTFEQIAEVLGTTPGAVRVRASRAYERLRRDLRAYIKRGD